MRKLNLNTIAIKFKGKQIDDFLENRQIQKVAISFVFIIGLTAFLVQFHKDDKKIVQEEAPSSIDTFIPEDQGLVTIQVSNYESLDQIIGQYGVVDLYAPPLIPGKKARLVMKRVKLIKTAKSPRHFNVLLPKDDVGILAGHFGEFVVSIRNPNLVGTKIVKNKAKPTKRRIYFESESL